MKQFYKLLYICMALGLSSQSCKSLREIALFQSEQQEGLKVRPMPLPDVTVIQANDLLAITVSSMDKNSNEILNFANVNRLQNVTYQGIQSQAGNNGQPLGYAVDEKGMVEIPLIGRVKVGGLSLIAAADAIRKLIDDNLVADPAINVRILNHKFSVMGEVGRPATFTLIDNRTTFPEALAMAGDIGVYGNRENVMLIRTTNNVQEVVRLNLTNQSIFESPYYYIKNGDVIYVEPLAEKATSTDRRVQLAPIVISSISTSIVLLTFIVNAFK